MDTSNIEEILARCATEVPTQDCSLFLPPDTKFYIAELESIQFQSLVEFYRASRGQILALGFDIQYGVASLLRTLRLSLNPDRPAKKIENLMQRKFAELIRILEVEAKDCDYLSEVFNSNVVEHLCDAKDHRNRWAHMPIAFIVLRDDPLHPYFAVMQDGKEQFLMPPSEVKRILSSLEILNVFLSDCNTAFKNRLEADSTTGVLADKHGNLTRHEGSRDVDALPLKSQLPSFEPSSIVVHAEDLVAIAPPKKKSKRNA